MKRLSFKSITLMCCMALSFGACQDIVTYNDNYDDEMASSGAPVIDAVYDSKDSPANAAYSLEKLTEIWSR